MAKQPFVPVAGVLRFRYAGTFQGAPWVNGFALSYNGTPPLQGQLDPLATALRQEWLSYWGGLLSDQTTLLSTTVWDISSTEGVSGVDNVVEHGQTVLTNLLPVNSAVVVSWPVVSRYRGGHFRTYIVPRSNLDITSGRLLNGSTVTAYQGAAAAFRTAVNTLSLNGSTLTLCGVRYFPTGEGVVRTSGRPFPFGVPAVHGRLDTQRRRLGKEVG